MSRNILNNKMIRTNAVQIILLAKKYSRMYLRRSVNIRIHYEQVFMRTRHALVYPIEFAMYFTFRNFPNNVRKISLRYPQHIL